MRRKWRKRMSVIWTELDAARLIIKRRSETNIWACHPDAKPYRYFNLSRQGNWVAINREKRSDGFSDRGYIIKGDIPGTA